MYSTQTIRNIHMQFEVKKEWRQVNEKFLELKRDIYSTRQKMLPIQFTVSPFSVPFSALFRFTVSLFRSPFYHSVLAFYHSKYRLSRERGAPRAVIAGECLEVLKLGRCSATILMVNTYAEPFSEPPIRASGPAAATRAARRFDKSQLGVPLCHCNWILSTHTPKS